MSKLEPAGEIVTRKVVAIRRDEEGAFEVELECGHRSIWFIDPPLGRSYCSQCLDDLIEKLREGKGAA